MRKSRKNSDRKSGYRNNNKKQRSIMTAIQAVKALFQYCRKNSITVEGDGPVRVFHADGRYTDVQLITPFSVYPAEQANEVTSALQAFCRKHDISLSADNGLRISCAHRYMVVSSIDPQTVWPMSRVVAELLEKAGVPVEFQTVSRF